jgi:hypothetical protein
MAMSFTARLNPCPSRTAFSHTIFSPGVNNFLKQENYLELGENWALYQGTTLVGPQQRYGLFTKRTWNLSFTLWTSRG